MLTTGVFLYTSRLMPESVLRIKVRGLFDRRSGDDRSRRGQPRVVRR